MKSEDRTRKPDRRIYKTKRSICNAFVDLLSRKDINEITITDIAKTADVNRKTIYNYYNGVYEILDEIENEIVANYESIIVNLDLGDDEDTSYKIFKSLTNVVSQNLDFYSKVIRVRNNSAFRTKIISTLTERLEKDFRKREMIDESKVSIVTKFIVSGMISAYIDWIDGGMAQSLDDLAKDVNVLVMKGVMPFLNKRN